MSGFELWTRIITGVLLTAVIHLWLRIRKLEHKVEALRRERGERVYRLGEGP